MSKRTKKASDQSPGFFETSKQKFLASSKSLKRITEYGHSKPIQFDLFEMLSPQDGEFSNTIKLYDFVLAPGAHFISEVTKTSRRQAQSKEAIE